MLAAQHKRAKARIAPTAQRTPAAMPDVSPVRRLRRSCACGGSCPSCQAKSTATVGAPGDTHEREADLMADRVLTMTAPAGDRSEYPGNAGARPQTIRAKTTTSDPADIALDTAAALSAARRRGEPLSAALRSSFEPRFGYDFAQVRVHADGEAADAALSVQARAYTSGSDIVFGAGEFAPGTSNGRRLLAHELTHVVQQSSGANAANGAPVVQRQALETGGDGPASAPAPTGAVRPVYVCTKPILGSTLHRQGHAFFRVGGDRPGLATYELEHARSCYCGWQGWPRRNVPEDRDADVPCVRTTIDEATLAANWNKYPVGQLLRAAQTAIRTCGSSAQCADRRFGRPATPPVTTPALRRQAGRARRIHSCRSSPAGRSIATIRNAA